MLAADKSIWLMFLGDEDPHVRELAAKHLEQILGHPVKFDASAEPAERAAQLASLRGEWGGEDKSLKRKRRRRSRKISLSPGTHEGGTPTPPSAAFRLLLDGFLPC